MNREQQEMALWRCEYVRSTMRDAENRSTEADAAVEQFRKRYPAEPAASAPVWYDDPPFPKDGKSYPCWVRGEDDACSVHWSDYAAIPAWRYASTEHTVLKYLNGRPVSPIIKPQEPTT